MDGHPDLRVTPLAPFTIAALLSEAVTAPTSHTSKALPVSGVAVS